MANVDSSNLFPHHEQSPMGPTTDPPPSTYSDTPISLTLSQLTTLLTNAVTQTAAAKTSINGLPSGVKVPTPEMLTGRKVKDVRTWHCTYWYESECDRTASYGLKDSAGFATFEDFAAALIRHLGDPNPTTKARNDLFKLTQVTSVKQYADEFQRIATLLPEMNFKDLSHFFHRGLKPQIRILFINKFDDSADWQTIRDLAYFCDDAVMTYRSSSSSFAFLSVPRQQRRDTRPYDPMDLGAISAEIHHQSHPSTRSATPGTASHRRSFTLHNLTHHLQVWLN
ncbi:hypothetical protein CEUSTIGMA_g13276.t1 [Chlamydomonas eustigma]|uniref:Retrotransposon gag domain-containing protein n=1 Tax=Chlamydomonas eustigma TaxID=1157962 RepID=A0A250XSS8_9CHLO|nr:hypothetical protein CEUSTIGMA_g13276.t1 [Chlamydomonas eustigma]|eukprot:GAX85860.1 hypothetical protein CEUSTIGMA_g13276.t1 [Chlamydomonas eustigma]